MFDGAWAVVGRDLQLLKRVQGPPQTLPQLPCKGRLGHVGRVLVEANCVRDAHGGAREVPTGIPVVRVVQMGGCQNQGLDGNDAGREHEGGQEGLDTFPPADLLFFGESDASDAAGEQQHAQQEALPCGIGLRRLCKPSLIGLSEGLFVEHGEIGIDVLEIGVHQGFQRGHLGSGSTAITGRAVVVGRRGTWRGERMRVFALLVRGGGLGCRILPKEHKLTLGAGAAQVAQFEMERKGACGADELHLALLVWQQRAGLFGVAALDPVALTVPVGVGRLRQGNAEREAQLAQLVEVGHVGFGEEALDEGFQQGDAVAQALDAAVQALLARLRRLALDVVDDAVGARLPAWLFSAFLLARLALVAAGLGALALVEGDAARIGRRGTRGRRRRHGRGHAVAAAEVGGASAEEGTQRGRLMLCEPGGRRSRACETGGGGRRSEEEGDGGAGGDGDGHGDAGDAGVSNGEAPAATRARGFSKACVVWTGRY